MGTTETETPTIDIDGEVDFMASNEEVSKKV